MDRGHEDSLALRLRNMDPELVRLGQDENFLQPCLSGDSTAPNRFQGDEIEIIPGDWEFLPNQNAEVTSHEDGSLEVTVLQENSTYSGVRSSLPIVMSPGNYVLTVVGFSDAESTFFPWVIRSRNKGKADSHCTHLYPPKNQFPSNSR